MAKKLSDKAVLVPTTVLRLNGPGKPIFSDSGQFVYCQSGAKFAVYDIDEDRRHYFELKDLPEDRVVSWMDSYRLTYNVGDRLRVVDFDGNNQQDLTVNSPAYKPIFTPDFSTILDIAPSIIVPGRPALTATPLKLK